MKLVIQRETLEVVQDGLEVVRNASISMHPESDPDIQGAQH